MSTHFKGKKREIAVLDTYIKLMRSSGSLSNSLCRLFSEFNLSGGQFGCLEILYHIGPLCQKEIGSKLFSTEGNITQIIDNLEKRKLVKRIRSQEDRRYITIHLTDSGNSLIKKAFPKFLEKLIQEMKVFDIEELEIFSRLCKKLGLKK